MNDPTRRALRALTAALLLAPGPASAADGTAPARPNTEVPLSGCVTEQCHGGVKRHKVVHGPVNVNACDGCHALTSAEKHTYDLVRPKNELCTFCHQVDDAGAAVVHQPVANGECLACHNPHGGFDRSFVRAESMNDLCRGCHQDVVATRKFVHGPVAAGACAACHAPHASPLPKLLLQQGRELCLNCHQEMARQLEAVKFAHEPVTKECSTCHDPHASDQRMMLLQPPAQLCTGTCHEPIRKAVSEARFSHSAVTRDVACVNCHNPHGGDLARLMKDQPLAICLNCHRDPIKVDEQRTVASVAEMVDPATTKHGPIRDGTCGGCHNVHGSDQPRLLALPYPATFYESFAAEHYELCFECHNREAIMVATTDKLTGFRNGDRNLHFLHVNKEKRGRTCRACHSTHASRLPFHIRESVPYGNWQLPLKYTPTATGGACAPGCHQELRYDRESPVPLEAGPTAPAAAGAAPAKEHTP